jgi:hypothetical protein
MVLPQQSQHPLFVDRLMLNEMPVNPETTIAPERVLGLARPNAWQQLLIALDYSQKPLPRQASRSSLVLTPR